MMKRRNPAKNEKGIALLVTMFAILLMIFLAVEIGFNTAVELRIGASQLERLKAYYLAKSGVNLSLLRINIYKVVMQRFGAQLGSNKSQLDMIWQMPFAWPPDAPPDLDGVDRDMIKKVVKESLIDGGFASYIEGESGKIDINDLASPSQAIQTATHAELVQILQNRLQQDDDWAHAHQNLQPEVIVNNIADWIDEDDQGRNGGDEKSPYSQTNPPIYPPNRSMKTIDELHMVAGVTDDIYNLLAPRLTVYGLKGINVNYASKDVIRGIDPQITDDIANKIVQRRDDPHLGGPYQSEQDFESFVQQQGVRMDNFNKNPPIPLFFDQEYNFRIRSIGSYGKATREIVAVVYDFGKVKAQLAAALASASPAQGGQPTPTPIDGGGQQGAPAPTPTAAPGAATANSSGPPQIVYWQDY
jgi:general secretion pathway protein K